MELTTFSDVLLGYVIIVLAKYEIMILKYYFISEPTLQKYLPYDRKMVKKCLCLIFAGCEGRYNLKSVTYIPIRQFKICIIEA